jgi:Rrf2 family protein
MMPGAPGREMTPPRLERTPMKLSRASRHVVQALVHLARQGPGVWVTAQEIGQAEGISDKFLGKRLGQLVKARLVRSVKGANGGYSLACAPKDITLLEIIETVDGPVRGDAPSVSDADATALDTRLQDVSDGAAALVREWLAEVTLAELARVK